MFTDPAFLPLSPLPSNRPTLVRDPSYIPSTCTTGPPKPSRRVFISRIATLLITSSASFRTKAAESDPAVKPTSEPPAQSPAQPPAQPSSPPAKAKPKRVSWGYAAENGPSKWGTLSEEWSLCSTGHAQSPVALSYREALPGRNVPRPKLSTFASKFSVRLKEASPNAINRSLIVEQYIPPPPPIVGDAPPFDTYTPPPPSAVIVMPNVATYFLRSIHFHADSSEHMLNGRRGQIEAHFVFGKRPRSPLTPTPSVSKDPDKTSEQPSQPAEQKPKVSDVDIGRQQPQVALKDDNQENGVVAAAQAEGVKAPHTLVVALVGFKSETCDAWVKEIVNGLPNAGKEEGKPAASFVELDLGKILPNFDTTDFYTYSGSLTTPPGTEGVQWIVLGKRAGVTQEEISKLVKIQGGANVRPLQPLNGRKVIRFPSLET